MEILFCRHGETDINTQGNTHTSDDQIGLNTTGKKQALKLASVARRHDIKLIFTSPERRALETAEIAGKSLGIKPTMVSELRERNWGDWNGEPWSTIEAKISSKSLKDRYSFTPPQGESWQQMEQRLLFAIQEIVSKASGNNIMIVTHGGALRAIVPTLKSENLERSLSYNFDNGSVTSFSYSQGHYTLASENDTYHL